jgi:glycosyltransferase involved in cell wall biosynthesis
VLIGVDAVSFAGPKTGIARYLHETLSWMMTIAPDVDFLLYSPAPIDVTFSPGSWRTHVPPSRRPLAPGRWLRETLPKMLADDQVDAYWGQNQMMPSRWLRACRKVLTVHDLAGFVCPGTMRLSHRLSWCLNMQAAVREADAVVAVSNATARLIAVYCGVPATRTTVIYPGYSPDLVPVSVSVARHEVKARFGLPDSFILTVGTLEPRKDHITLLEAVTRNVDLPLLAVVGGIGWRSQRIARLVRKAEAASRVRYLGRVSDMDLAALYGAARVMVYPSFYEGFGSPIVEAMACGCPVLCSWSSSLPEVGGGAVRYFHPGDTDDLARQFRGLLGSEGTLSGMRSRGFEQAAAFSYARTAEQILDVMRG